ncbi:hypothetical protein DH2020_001175 [Rehmannia glutinosa]|uniref:Non-structural maintenance of chromosomes element 4 n=1 Tax=Rehmannia glutinosa TaxID=99300 RepID=A0ABR0XZ18_REHGL
MQGKDPSNPCKKDLQTSDIHHTERDGGKLKRERVTDNGGDSDSIVVEETDELTQENDPVSKRRDIRSHYREIENRINVKKPREQIADAEALLGLTRHLTASVKTHTSGDITPAEIGPIENKLKQRKLVVRAKRSKSIRKAQPKELEKAAEVTVENLFALSFLVKDGRVRIDVNDNGSQVVVPTNGPSAEEIKSGVARSHQFVFRFDFDDWKLMKTQVPEGEELMPQRDTFTNSCYDNANTQPCDQDLSIPEGIPIDSRLILTAPVKKFSKNYGRTMLNSCLTQIDGGTTGIGVASVKEALCKL